MNIAQAKQIPLAKLVEHLGGIFSHTDNQGNLWYRSPFRPDERTPSFKIDVKTNKWHDFARTNKIDAHGDTLDLWTDYHNLPRRGSNAIKQALASLRENFGSLDLLRVEKQERKKNHARILKPARYRLIKPPGKIWIDSLKIEVARRGLTLSITEPYLKQATIEDTKTNKRYYGFAIRNDKGGYELSIPNPHKNECFKTAISPKAITTIQGNDPSSAYVFEGFWDCFTWLAMNRSQNKIPMLYILNSTSLVQELANKLITPNNTVQSIFLFLDNDAAGLKAQTRLLDLVEPHNFIIGTMNHLYKDYKDFSDYWMDIRNFAAPNLGNPKWLPVTRTPI